MSVAPSPPHDFEAGLELDFVPDDQPVDAPADPEPIPAPEPLPDHDPIPFGIPDIAPLIPDPVLAPADPPVIEPVTSPLAPTPADVAPFQPGESEPAFVLPRSSPSPFSHPPAPLTPFPEFDTRFLTVEQQISYLLRHVYQLEEELAHVRSLLFVPPPPPPPPLA
ncbi:lysine-rich arabinogalactan protein 19-like [Helianthus annuus]|uniref:lysine-rich arabinogalactan protein 19-like n=1 Tax=Helianthus annuus TaxID=4232 RepID=UPI000B903679|nr:lysine-rich arabinogalactan protein 19-like [Helianthus annuus]